MKRQLFMGSTEVEASRTASQISALLIQAGARSIQMDFDAQGAIVGMRFVLMVGGIPHPFKMPARIDPVFEILQARRRTPHDRLQNESRDREAAARIGWRQLFRWTEVQIAFAASGMASVHEVLLPYLVEQGGRTVFEVFEETRFKALPAAKGA
jgi:hypothetical protein